MKSIRFSLSSLFMLIAFIGILLGWIYDNQRKSKEYQALFVKYQKTDTALKTVLEFAKYDNDTLNLLNKYDLKYHSLRSSFRPATPLPNATEIWRDTRRILDGSIDCLWHQQIELEGMDVK